MLSLKDLKDHPVIWLITVFAGLVLASVSATWKVVEVVRIAPLEREIANPKEQLANVKGQPGRTEPRKPPQEPPSALPYKVYSSSATHSYGSWLNTIFDQLAREGGTGTALARVEFDPFASAIKRFKVILNPPSGVKISGGYAFYVQTMGDHKCVRQLAIDYRVEAGSISVSVPESAQQDSLMLALRFSGSQTSDLETLFNVRIEP